MSKDNSSRVARFAAIYPVFRSALRADPHQAFRLFANDLRLVGDIPLEPGEIQAVTSISDEAFSALARIITSLGKPFEKSEAPTSCFIL